MSKSLDGAPADAIHFGTDLSTGKPVFIPLDVFKQHAVIRGMTGAMKSVFLTYILSQIVERTEASVVLVDFGGDLFTFNAIKEVAEKRQKNFRFLSTGFEDDWDSFNPLRACVPLSDANLIRATNYLVTSLSLSFGEGFQTGYFGDISTLTIQDTLSHCIDSGIPNPSIKQIADVTLRTSKSYRKNDVAQAEMALRQLGNYPQLLPAKDGDREIRFDRAIENGEVVVGFLPGLLEPMSVKVGALLAWSAILAAIDRAEKGLPKRNVFLVLEECSVIAKAPSFIKALVLARKYGIRIIMLHQTSEQLRGGGHSPDLRPIVSDNTALKLYLTSTTKDDVEQLRGFSEDIERTRDGGKSFNGLNASTQIRGVYEPRLERNEILHASAVTGEGYLVVNDGKKHVEPKRIRFDPTCYKEVFTPENHSRLSGVPLPKRNSTCEASALSSAKGEGGSQLEKAVSTESASRQKMIRALITKCQQEEQWNA